MIRTRLPASPSVPDPIRRDRDDALDLLPHIPALRRYALLLTCDRDSADDLVQECLLRAIAHADRFQPGTKRLMQLLGQGALQD